MKSSIKTIGLNVQIIKDTTDLNNVKYEVVHVKSWKEKTLVAVCGNFNDAEAVALDVNQ